MLKQSSCIIILWRDFALRDFLMDKNKFIDTGAFRRI